MLADADFKACYFNRHNPLYVKMLAEERLNNHIDLSKMEKLSDEDIRSKLIKLKGIGNWTIDIYLMLALQRKHEININSPAAKSFNAGRCGFQGLLF